MKDAAQEAVANWRGRVEERLDNLIASNSSARIEEEAFRRDMRQVIQSLSGSVQACAQQISDIGPSVIEHRQKFAELQGAAKLGKVVWGGIIGGSAAIGAVASKVIDHIK
jgi:hypothetical protein